MVLQNMLNGIRVIFQNMIYKEIKKCRVCGNENLRTVIDLGNMYLTGFFPKPGEVIDSSPLDLVKCWDEGVGKCCGLVQLRHTYDLGTMYGDNYGYRSGLNASMVKHLYDLVKEVESRVQLNDGDLVIDIASNDGTLLGGYVNQNAQLVGIDPTAAKFKEYYRNNITIVPEFFSSKLITSRFKEKAKVITSVAMFYDLEDPIKFMEDIKEILANDGLWVIEQSYMPFMIENTSYDTICHEHIEYYGLAQIDWMVKKVGLKIVDVDFNNANGGSFRVTMAQATSAYKENVEKIQKILNEEKANGYDEWPIYHKFAEMTKKHKEDLIQLLTKLKLSGKKIFGYGASTKGNVILQYCNFGLDFIPAIAEVNEYKYGRLTPGTNIPIISEEEAKKLNPDYLLVLPWHFRENTIMREHDYLNHNGHLIFPLPKIEIV